MNNNNEAASVKALEDQSVETTEQRWLAMSGSARTATEKQHIQRAWDGPVVTELLSQASSETDKAADSWQLHLRTLVTGSTQLLLSQ